LGVVLSGIGGSSGVSHVSPLSYLTARGSAADSGRTRSNNQSDAHCFVVLPKRWIVERTFGWFFKYRRLSKDYETLPSSSETMIYLAMINLILHRLKPG
jgi:putative transposase